MRKPCEDEIKSIFSADSIRCIFESRYQNPLKFCRYIWILNSIRSSSYSIFWIYYISWINFDELVKQEETGFFFHFLNDYPRLEDLTFPFAVGFCQSFLCRRAWLTRSSRRLPCCSRCNFQMYWSFTLAINFSVSIISFLFYR